jgi:hypothetical protein
MTWIWRIGGRVHDELGDHYYFFLYGTDHKGRHLVPDGVLVSVADFWGRP